MSEGSRKGQREKLNCDVVATKAPADPIGSFGTSIVFRAVQDAGRKVRLLYILSGFGLVSGRGYNLEMVTSFLPKAVAGNAAITITANTQDNQRNLHPEGDLGDTPTSTQQPMK